MAAHEDEFETYELMDSMTLQFETCSVGISPDQDDACLGPSNHLPDATHQTEPGVTRFAGEQLIIFNKRGILDVLPRELFDLVLESLLLSAFSSVHDHDNGARMALRALAGTNSVMKTEVQVAITRQFAIWSATQLRLRVPWLKIAEVYNWVQERNLAFRY